MSAHTDQPLYEMRAAASRLRMHPQTLRKYERAGMVRPARTDGYHRMYSERELARLAGLRRLSQRGVNVAGLRLLASVYDSVKRMEAALAAAPALPRIDALRAELAALRRLLALEGESGGDQ